ARGLFVRIERIDQGFETLADDAAAHFARAREFAVIGVQFLVQDQETADLRASEMRFRRQVAVHLGYAIRYQIVHRLLRRQLLIAGRGDATLLGPISDRFGVDVD